MYSRLSIYIYPEDLGYSSCSGAYDKIKHLNAINAAGRNNWRLPTIDELKLIAENLNLLAYKINGKAWSSETHCGGYRGDPCYPRFYDFDEKYDSYSNEKSMRIILVSTK